MNVRRAACAAALIAVAAAALAVAAGELGRSAPAQPWPVRGTWTIVERGARGGRTWIAPRGGTIGAVYLPRRASRAHRLSAIYLLVPRVTAGIVERMRLAGSADDLIWQGTVPRFAVVVAAGGGDAALTSAVQAAHAHLPVRGDSHSSAVVVAGGWPGLEHLRATTLARSFGTAVVVRRARAGSPRAERWRLAAARRHLRVLVVTPQARPAGELFSAFAAALAPARATRASAAATGMLPAAFSRIAVGPSGGTIWQGVIPGVRWTAAPRASLIYLPPGIDRRRRYPVVYLLHGIRGAPSSFPSGLRLTAVADDLIAARRAPPFIAVMPPAGATPAYTGEWTGTWEHYVVPAIVHYVDRVLPAIERLRGRAIGGLSAGGYGAFDIALRHPGVFGAVEAWSGYFAAPHDGSLAHASARQLAEHDPAKLVRRQARALRASGVRFYLSAGRRDPEALGPTRRFARELRRLGLRPALVVTAGGHTTRTWRTGLARALEFAAGRPPPLVTGPARRAGSDRPRGGRPA